MSNSGPPSAAHGQEDEDLTIADGPATAPSTRVSASSDETTIVLPTRSAPQRTSVPPSSEGHTRCLESEDSTITLPPARTESDAPSTSGSSSSGEDATAVVPPAADDASTSPNEESTLALPSHQGADSASLPNAASTDETQVIASETAPPRHSRDEAATTVALPPRTPPAKPASPPTSHSREKSAEAPVSSDPDEPTVVPSGASSAEAPTITYPAAVAAKVVPLEGPQTVIQPVDPQATLISKSVEELPDTRPGGRGASWSQPEIHVTHPGRQEQADARQSDQARYELGDDFARGGLGKIRKAIDVKLQREVAYKELLPKGMDDPGMVERFMEEAQITGQLEHPGIVPIYDLGWQDNGTPFYAMKFVRGDTFRKAIEDLHAMPPISPERQVRFVKYLHAFVEICNAIAFAHHRGVLHRDLKPHNVMLGQFGETLVLDWGLAKIVGTADLISDVDETLTQLLPGREQPAAPMDPTVVVDNAHVTSTAQTAASRQSRRSTSHVPATQVSRSQSLSRTQATGMTGARTRQSVATNVRTDASKTMVGSVLGTPSYMPPEQARGENDLDVRADIYSLGAILYELLAGRPPIPKGEKMFERIIQGKIPPPRSIDKSISPVLEAIALKALARQREDRYSSALHLAADVERYLADEPTSVYREPWKVRLWRWTRKHWTLVTNSALAVGLILLSVAGFWGFESQRRARVIAHARGDLDAARSALAATPPDLQTARQKHDLVRTQRNAEPVLNVFEGELRTLELAIAERAQEIETARLQKIRREAEDKLTQAQTLAEVQKDYPRAAALLAEIGTLLKLEPRLSDLAQLATERKGAVDRTLIEQRAQQAENARFAQFEELVDRARFFACNLVRDAGQRSSELVTEAGEKALALYKLEPGKSLQVPPQLTPSQAARLREHLQEVLVLLAVTQRTGSQVLPEEDQRPMLVTALTHLRHAATLRKEEQLPESQSALLLESVILSEMGRKAEADKLRQTAEALKPQTAADFFLLGQHEQNVNRRYPEACLRFQEALAKEPDHYLALFSLGLCNLQQLSALGKTARGDEEVTGFLSAATTAFTGCVALKPDSPWAYLMRGVATFSQGRVPEAFDDLKRAEDLQKTPGVYDPETFRFALHVNRGTIYFFMDQWEEAEREFQTAGQIVKSPEPSTMLARIAARREQFDVALQHLATAAQRDPQSAQTFRLIGDVYTSLHARDPQKYPDKLAIESLEKALALEPSSGLRAGDLYDLGRIHFRSRRWQPALNAFDRSLKESRKDPDVDRLRGEVLLELKRLPEAVDAFTEYLKRSKNPQADAYRARGLAYAAIGKYREATHDYTRSLELDPRSANIHTRLGWAYLLKNYQLAEQDFDAAIAENPENGDSYNGRGFARVKQGKHAEGVADAEAAVKAGPDVWPTYFNAAGVYAQAIPALARDPRLAEDEERAVVRDRYVNRAVELLKKAAAIANPAEFAANLKGDDSLDPLRETEGFKQLLP